MIDKHAKIFVTGGSGLVGSYILRELINQGFSHIYALKRNSSTITKELTTNQITWLEGDILDAPLMYDYIETMDVIIHAAANVAFSLRDRENLIATAHDGTANLVNAALEFKISKFVFISSVAAIGRQKLEEEITEKKLFSHSKYDTTYGLSKFLAEQEVWRGHAEGLSVAILNPSLILGIGNWSRSSIKLFNNIYYKKFPFYPVGTTGWVAVSDVAKAALLSLDPNIDGERFIISAENRPYRDVFMKIATGLGIDYQGKPMSRPWAQIIWRVEAIKSFFTGSNPVVTKETIHSTSAASMYDNSKSIKMLKMSYTNIDTLIAECCKAYLASK